MPMTSTPKYMPATRSWKIDAYDRKYWTRKPERWRRLTNDSAWDLQSLLVPVTGNTQISGLISQHDICTANRRFMHEMPYKFVP